jgi:flagellar motor switch protein FliG
MGILAKKAVYVLTLLDDEEAIEVVKLLTEEEKRRLKNEALNLSGEKMPFIIQILQKE